MDIANAKFEKPGIRSIFNNMECEFIEDNFDLAWKWLKFNLTWINENLDSISLSINEKNEIIFNPKDLMTDVNKEYEPVDQPATISAFQRVQILVRLGNLIEKEALLFGQLSCLRSKSVIHHLMANDVAYFVSYFKHFCTLPMECGSNYLKLIEKIKKRKTVYDPCNSFYDLCWYFGPAIIFGVGLDINTMNEDFILPFMLFKKLCFQAGMRKNEITTTSAGIYSRDIQNNSLVQSCKGEGLVMVFNDADIDAVVDCVVEDAQFHWRKISWAMKNFLVQESILKSFLDKLLNRIKKVQESEKCFNNNKIYGKKDGERLAKIISEAKADGFDVLKVKNDNEIALTVFIGHPSIDSTLIDNTEVVLDLPIITVETFRTIEEGVKLVNSNGFLSSAVSIWTESLSVVVKVPSLLNVTTIWINSHGLHHPAVPLCVPPHGLKDLKNDLIFSHLDQIRFTHENDLVNRVVSNLCSSQEKEIGTKYESLVSFSSTSQKKWHGLGPLKRSNILTAIALKLFEEKDKFDSLSKIPTHKISESNKTSSPTESAVETLLQHASICRSSESNSIFFMREALVKLISEPVGLIFVKNFKFTDVQEFIWLIAPLLSKGNAVIMTVDEKGRSIANEFLKLSKSVSIYLNGVLDFIIEPGNDLGHGDIKMEIDFFSLTDILLSDYSKQVAQHAHMPKFVWSPGNYQ